MDETLDLLLLGATGFVGSALLRECAAMAPGSVRVRALVRRPGLVTRYPFVDEVTGSLEHLPSSLEPSRPYVLVHFAVKQTDTDGTGYLQTNVEATRRLLGALGPKLRGVVYGSSMSVYGQGAQDGVSEATLPHPGTPLAESRLRAEDAIFEAAESRKVTAFSLRPRFVVGEGDRFVMPALARLAQKRVGIAGGSPRFSVIDVADYARVILRLALQAAERHGAGTPVQQALNVGYQRPVSMSEIGLVLRDELDLPEPRWRIPVWPSLTRWLHRVPMASVDQLATRLELIGMSHWGDTSALSQAVGPELVGKDPVDVLRSAASALSREGRPGARAFGSSGAPSSREHTKPHTSASHGAPS